MTLRDHAALFVTALLTTASPACQRPADENPAEDLTTPVHCATAETAQLEDTRSLRGTVVTLPDHDAIVAAQVPGKVLAVRVRAGDEVEAGSVVAEIEAGPLRQAVASAKAQLAQARAASATASSTFTREQHLFERGIRARQSVEAAEDGLAHAKGAVAGAKAALEVAELDLERTHVRAPLPGVVIRVMRGAGELVDGTDATALLEIADPSELELSAMAPAADLVALRVGQSATIRFDALPSLTFSATVRTVAAAVETSGLGPVHLSIVTDQVRPPLGLLGRADVHTGEARTSVSVPAAALRNAGGTRTEVVVCEQGRARVADVRVGVRSDDRVEVLDGLAADERVVVEGLIGLEDGARLEESP